MYSIVAKNELGKDSIVLEDTLIVETLRINGDNVITFDIEYTDNNAPVFEKIDKRWVIKVINGSIETEYIVQNIYEKTFGDSLYLSVDTLYAPHDKMKREMVYKEYTGSKTRDEWFNWVFKESSLKLDMRASEQYALSLDNFGMDSVLSLFFDLLDKFHLEYYFDGANRDTVVVVDKIGEDKSDYISYGVNLISLNRTRQMGGFGTFGVIYGAYKDEEKPELGRYTESYRSPLADHYGIIPIKPISDERFKVKENMIAEIKNAVDNSIITSIEVEFDELTFERDDGWVSIGDSILLMDERLGLSVRIRVFEINTTYNHFGEIVSITYVLGDYDEHYLSVTEAFDNPKKIDDRFNKSKNDLLGWVDSTQEDLFEIREKLQVTTDMANSAGKIYRQRLRPIGDGIAHGDLWYQPVWNSVAQREDVKMYQYQKDGATGKWVEVQDIEMGNADNLNRGQINAKTINLINLNADEIVTGTIRGKNLKIDLDRGNVEFVRGKIYKDDDTFVIDVDNGSIHSKSTVLDNWFSISKGQLRLSSKLGLLGKELGKITSGRMGLGLGTSGLLLEGHDGVTMANYDFNQVVGLGTIHGGAVRILTNREEDNKYNGTMIDVLCDETINFQTGNFLRGSTFGLSEEFISLSGLGRIAPSNGIKLDGEVRNGAIQISAGTDGLLGTTKRLADLDLHASKKVSMRGKAEGVEVVGDFKVTGKKNAIHVTRDGVRETPAYEMASSYIGDIGEVVTSPSGIAIVEIPDIFYDIANFDENYQVFTTTYDFCMVKVSARFKDYFVIETDKGNCRVGYEIKAKRRGYEDEWFTKVDMSNEEIQDSFTDIVDERKILDEHNKYQQVIF